MWLCDDSPLFFIIRYQYGFKRIKSKQLGERGGCAFFFFLFCCVYLVVRFGLVLQSLPSSHFLNRWFLSSRFPWVWLGSDFSLILASKGTATEMKHF